MANKIDFRRLALSGVAFGAMAFGGLAYAQEADTDENDDVIVNTTQEEDETEARQERVVVTGSLLRRDEFTSSSPIQVITAEVATLEGLIDTADILQSSSIAAGSTQINGNFGGFVVEGGTGVNTVSLRGLGAQRTLVLFNSRRLGPAGTQGQVGAVDLNVIPDSVISRIEILKDGASSIYGSDAVAGVVNIITRRDIEDPEINFTTSIPFEGGGESYGIDGAFGLNFDRGSLVFSASYERFEDLTFGDRDIFSCPQDYVFDPVTGERRDLIDTTPGVGTGDFKCFNALADVYDTRNGARRFIFDPAIGGFRQRAAGNAGVAETPSDNPAEQATDVIPFTERYSIYVTGDYDLGFADVFVDALYNNRKTEQTDFRQFFPWNAASDPFNPDPVAFSRPITLVPFDTGVDISYYSVTGGLRGELSPNFGPLSNWAWEVAAVYSKSDGDYERDTIPLNRTNDPIRFGTVTNVRNLDGSISCTYVADEEYAINGAAGARTACPVVINYFSEDFVFGRFTPEEADFLFEKDFGNTVYEQTTISGTMAGDLFQLPAGPIGVGVGAEYRTFEINDQPGFFSRNNNQWGLSSAVETVGDDSVWEVFGEIEVPILAGQPFAEELTLNLSGRYFEYDSYGSDSVYKAGLNWQVTPMVRARATMGTSYRTPALYELFLGNLTSFAGQGNIDPCNFQDGGPLNPLIRQNCLSQVPDDYIPFGSSAEVTTGGGAGVLEPETSDAMTVGLIFTPSFIDLSIAIDYFSIEVNDQIAQLGSGSILAGCYGSNNFPNDPLCTLFERDLNPASPTFLQILTVNDSYVNINSQTTEGLDLTLRYEREMDIGDLIIDMQGTWTFVDEFLLFTGEDFEPDDFNGSIGDPDFVANAGVRFIRGDWSYQWFTDFTARNSNDEIFGGSVFTYRGAPGYFKQYAEAQWYHGASVQYRGDEFSVTLGVNNIFDEAPPFVSTGAATRRGNAALVGTQYDYRGRSVFARVSKTF